MIEKLNTFRELNEKKNQAISIWNRQILTIASGGLALLVAFQPEASSEGIDKYLLVSTWITLGIGILSAAGATYSEASLAKNLVYQYEEELLKILEEKVDRAIPTFSAEASLLCRISRKLMVFSLLLSVVSLVAYATIRTLTN